MSEITAENQYNILIKEHQELKLNRDDNTDLILENHHITPTALGGGNESENLVMLPAQIHWEAHRLLAEIYPTRPMITAFFLMCRSMRSKGVEVSGKEYEKARRVFIELGVSEETRAKLSEAGKGRVFTEKHKSRLSYAGRGRAMSDETKVKIGNTLRGGTVSKETKTKISKALKGNQHLLGHMHTPEALKKMSDASSGSNNPAYDHTIYTFKHKDGAIFNGTQYDFRIKYDLNRGSIYDIIYSRYKFTKGWRLATKNLT